MKKLLACTALFALAAPVVAQQAPATEETATPAQPSVGGQGAGGVAGGTGNGPDVIVSSIGSTVSTFTAIGGVGAHAFTTVSCNLGEAEAIWIDSGALDTEHPVIGQNLYRIKNNRIEQIGQAWLKHGFCAADAPSCGSPYEPNGSCDWLGTHATDTYSASLNSSQPGMGPKSEVNPWTGDFPYPYILGAGASGNSIYKRMQVAAGDLNPANNAGALYFIESQYVCTDEAEINRYNNVSYRRVNIGTAVGGTWNLVSTGSTFTQTTPIAAWQANSTGVVASNVDVPGDGRMVFAYRTADNGNGTWHYDYVIYNMNSHRSAQSFSVAIPAGVTISNVYFKDVAYHSGEPYSGTDWASSLSGGLQTWTTDSFAVNANANALRWGTLYNFSFDADTAPDRAEITIGLFRPGTPSSISFSASGPSAPPTDPCDGAVLGDANCDTVVDFFDIDPFLTALFDNAAYLANGNWCGTNCNVDIDGNDAVDFFDIDPFLNCLFNGCP